jgi:hypothetical protein
VAAGVVTPVQPLDPEEQSRRVAVAIQEAEVAAAQSVIEAAAATEARIAMERAQAESVTSAKTVPCVLKYTDMFNCITVTFGYNTKYKRTNANDHCPVIDPKNVVVKTSLGGNQWSYEGPNGLTVQFFDVPKGGVLPSGKICGK